MGHMNAGSDLLGDRDQSVLKTCPLCTCEYSQSDVRVLEEEEGLQLIHVTCATCQNAILAYIVDSSVGMSSVGMLTDLSVADVSRIQNAAPIDEDVVLALAKELRHNQKHFIYSLMQRMI